VNYYSMKHQKLQQVLLIFILALLPQFLYSQISIPTDYYGINAWMPDSVGTQKYYGRQPSKPPIRKLLEWGGLRPTGIFTIIFNY